MDDADGKSKEDLMYEISEKSVVSIGSFGIKRFLTIIYTYLITSLFGASFYGIFSVFVRMKELSMNFLYGVSKATERTLPRQNTENQKTVLLLNFILLVIIWSLIVIPLILFRDTIVANTVLENNQTESIVIFSATTFPLFIIFSCSSILKAFRRIRISMILSVIGFPVTIIISLILSLLFIQDVTISSFWVIMFIVNSVFSIFAIYTVSIVGNYDYKFDFNIELAKEYMNYFKSSLLSTIFRILKRRIVFVAMAIYLSPITAGLFSVSLIIGNLARWPLNGINQIFPAIATQLYDAQQKDKLKYLYKTTSKIGAFICTLIILLVIPYATQLLTIFSPEYSNYSIILPIIMSGQFVATIIGSVGLLLLMTDNEEYSFYSNFMTSMVVVPTLILSTQQFGVYGLAISYLVSLVVDNGIQVILLSQLEGLFPITKDHITITVLSTVVLVLNIGSASLLPIYASLIVISILMLVYGYVIITKVFDNVERNCLKKIKSSVQNTLS